MEYFLKEILWLRGDAGALHAIQRFALMKTLEAIFSEAERLGVNIEFAADGFIELSPADRVPRDFVAAVRERSAELRAALVARASSLHLTKQILLGEFDACKDSTRRRLVAALRQVPHPLARRALEQLDNRKAQP